MPYTHKAPHCRECNQAIRFVALLKDPRTGETGKQLPLDLEPVSTGGGVALIEWPFLLTGKRYPPGPEVRTVGRRITDAEARFYRRGGGQVFKIHFDTCSARNRNRVNFGGPVCQKV